MQRYDRQIVLPEIGHAGQKKINEARVLCVGTGGLGCPTSLYLAAAGVGTIGIIDHDDVDESNLQRQVLFTTADIATPKVLAAKRRLELLNPNIQIQTWQTRLTSKNALEIFSNFDIIIDGTDNFSTKFLINDAAAKLRKPLIYGSISQWEGRASVFWAGNGPCYRCLHPEPPKVKIQNCAESGVIGAVAGIIGSIQAAEAIKLILGMSGTLLGKLFVIDCATMQSSTFSISQNKSCPICSKNVEAIELKDETEICAINILHAIRELDAKEVLASGLVKFNLIDVRELDEWNSYRIPNAVHLPLSELENNTSIPTTLQIDATKKNLVYCMRGARSARAISLLSNLGWKNLYNLQGGISSWDGPLE